MYPYLRNETEMEQFRNIYDVADKLFSKRTSSREKAADELAGIGKKAVRPLVYAIQCAIESSMSDDEIDALAQDVENILVKIGNSTLEDLDDFSTNEHCNIYINEFAQKVIFRINGLHGKDKRNICKHID